MGEAVKKFQEYFGLPVTGEAGGRGDDERYEGNRAVETRTLKKKQVASKDSML